jgi:shikimate kinase
MLESGASALPPRIYLLGFMGSGKSALGAKLARRLDYAFEDLDARIVERAGCSIRELFAARGEGYFRALEGEMLRETAAWNQTLVALGGGTPCFGDNMDWIVANGFSVYLRVPVAVLLGRLRKRQQERPLIAGLDPAQLEAFIRETLDKREPYYSRAHWCLDAAGMSPAEVETGLRRVWAGHQAGES